MYIEQYQQQETTLAPSAHYITQLKTSVAVLFQLFGFDETDQLRIHDLAFLLWFFVCLEEVASAVASLCGCSVACQIRRRRGGGGR